MEHYFPRAHIYTIDEEIEGRIQVTPHILLLLTWDREGITVLTYKENIFRHGKDSRIFTRPFDGISHSSAQFLVEIGEENLGR